MYSVGQAERGFYVVNQRLQENVYNPRQLVRADEGY